MAAFRRKRQKRRALTRILQPEGISPAQERGRRCEYRGEGETPPAPVGAAGRTPPVYVRGAARFLLRLAWQAGYGAYEDQMPRAPAAAVPGPGKTGFLPPAGAMKADSLYRKSGQIALPAGKTADMDLFCLGIAAEVGGEGHGDIIAQRVDNGVQTEGDFGRQAGNIGAGCRLHGHGLGDPVGKVHGEGDAAQRHIHAFQRVFTHQGRAQGGQQAAGDATQAHRRE